MYVYMNFICFINNNNYIDKYVCCCIFLSLFLYLLIRKYNYLVCFVFITIKNNTNKQHQANSTNQIQPSKQLLTYNGLWVYGSCLPYICLCLQLLLLLLNVAGCYLLFLLLRWWFCCYCCCYWWCLVFVINVFMYNLAIQAEHFVENLFIKHDVIWFYKKLLFLKNNFKFKYLYMNYFLAFNN